MEFSTLGVVPHSTANTVSEWDKSSPKEVETSLEVTDPSEAASNKMLEELVSACGDSKSSGAIGSKVELDMGCVKELYKKHTESDQEAKDKSKNIWTNRLDFPKPTTFVAGGREYEYSVDRIYCFVGPCPQRINVRETGDPNNRWFTINGGLEQWKEQINASPELGDWYHKHYAQKQATQRIDDIF